MLHLDQELGRLEVDVDAHQAAAGTALGHVQPIARDRQRRDVGAGTQKLHGVHELAGEHVHHVDLALARGDEQHPVVAGVGQGVALVATDVRQRERGPRQRRQAGTVRVVHQELQLAQVEQRAELLPWLEVDLVAGVARRRGARTRQAGHTGRVGLHERNLALHPQLVKPERQAIGQLDRGRGGVTAQDGHRGPSQAAVGSRVEGGRRAAPHRPDVGPQRGVQRGVATVYREAAAPDLEAVRVTLPLHAGDHGVGGPLGRRRGHVELQGVAVPHDGGAAEVLRSGGGFRDGDRRQVGQGLHEVAEDLQGSAHVPAEGGAHHHAEVHGGCDHGLPVHADLGDDVGGFTRERVLRAAPHRHEVVTPHVQARIRRAGGAGHPVGTDGAVVDDPPDVARHPVL